MPKPRDAQPLCTAAVMGQSKARTDCELCGAKAGADCEIRTGIAKAGMNRLATGASKK